MRTSGVTDVVVGLHPDNHPRRAFDSFTQVSAHAAKVDIDGPRIRQRGRHVARGSAADSLSHLSGHAECVR